MSLHMKQNILLGTEERSKPVFESVLALTLISFTVNIEFLALVKVILLKDLFVGPWVSFDICMVLISN